VYDSDHLYDFDAALEASLARASNTARRRHELEADTGARLVSHTAGARAVSARQLERHARLYGPNDIDELIPHLAMSGTPQSGPETDGRMRPLKRSSREEGRYPWDTSRKLSLGRKILALHRRGRMPAAIAETLGKNVKVVRRYLREAEAAGLV
jgi:hypothetical protein